MPYKNVNWGSECWHNST